MKSLLLLIAMLSLGISLRAQIFRIPHDVPMPAHSFQFGLESGGSGASGMNPDTGERFYFHNYRFRPRLTFLPFQNFALGLQLEYQRIWTNLAKAEQYWGYGTFVRYYWGSRQIEKESIRLRFNYFLEANYNRSTNPGGELIDWALLPAPSEQPQYVDASLILGVHIKLWRGLFADIGLGPHYIPQDPQQRFWQFGGRLGLDWVFGS